MSNKMLNYQEFLLWLEENKEKVIVYLKNNDEDIKNVEISGRAYTVLRLNGKNSMSDVILCDEDEINSFYGIAGSTKDEILLLKREYLRDHKNALLSFVNGEPKCTDALINEIEVVDVEQHNESEIISGEEISKEQIISVNDVKEMLLDRITKEKFAEFAKERNVDISYFNMSARSYNVLKRGGINFLHEMIKYYPDDFFSFHNMGKMSVDEICSIIENYLLDNYQQFVTYANGDTTAENTVSPYELDTFILINHPQYKEKAREYIKARDIIIDDMGLSVRSTNALFRAGVKSFYDLIDIYPNNISLIKNLGTKSINEIAERVTQIFSEMKPGIAAYCNGDIVEIKNSQESQTDATSLTVLQLLKHPQYKDKATQYFLENNFLVKDMELSVRSVNGLMNAKIFTFFDLMKIYTDDLYKTQNIGRKSIDEIKLTVEHYFSKLNNVVWAYCTGDINAMYTDEFLEDSILKCFKDAVFNGLSYKEIRQNFPEELDDWRIKKHIGKLIKSRELEYVDFRLYKVYPSVITVIKDSALLEEDKEIIIKKLDGMTLEAIAQELGLTRERVRQRIAKSFGTIHKQLHFEQKSPIFDEDYYTVLYSNYETPKDFMIDYLGVSNHTYGYLANFCDKGNLNLELALSDERINPIIKFRIQDYLNKDKILIDGILIEKQRSAIENYALSKIAKDEISFSDFCEGYNELLKNNNIPFDEKIYYTESVRRTRGNHLTESMFCLWKHGERLRYYDIEGQDYKELFDILHLRNYENTEVSTLKFMNDYPEIMEKYDIRDQYELHNLLKKTVNPNECNDISFNRQPMIQFGAFDREKAIYEIIATFAPISVEELLEYIYSEYGYDKATAQAAYIQPFNKYLHQGIYSIDFKQISAERIPLLKAKLTEDFYYISQAKGIYADMFENADVEEINSYTLKSMGFLVYSKYAVQNFPSAEAYFKHILTANDIYDISVLNKKFASIYRTFYNAEMELKQAYDIFLFEKDQIITMNRLSKLGITKADIKNFCDEVANFVSTEYFTVHSLRGAGFVSELDNLGFDDYFYAGILAMDDRFLWQSVFDTIVLTLKEEKTSNTFTKKDFLSYELLKYDSIDVDTFISDCFDEYGVKIDRCDIKQIFAGTQVYYDSIMNKLYSDKKYYYEEFDE